MKRDCSIALRLAIDGKIDNDCILEPDAGKALSIPSCTVPHAALAVPWLHLLSIRETGGVDPRRMQ